MPQTVLLIHGGAGTMPPAILTPPRRQSVMNGLRAALRAGQALLAAGAPAMDAVVAAVSALEDDPNFNAGRGAVYTSAGTHEMDAALMDGASRRLGAIAGVVGPRNPIQGARLVLENSPHVLLAGPGAIAFLQANGLPFEPASYFGTPERRAALEEMLRADHELAEADDFNRHGTVGAVALDSHGNLAAATSTGGMTGKAPGRIGDTPVAGAGTWADTTCAFSATGHGESFIRAAAGHEVSARMRLVGEDLHTATAAVIADVESLGGTGGLIALDRHGNVAMPFNTRGMYRGQAIGGAAPKVAIYAEDLA